MAQDAVHLRFAAHVPRHPFWPLTSILTDTLVGASGVLPPGSTVSVLTPKFGMGDVENLRAVACGEADIGLTTPTNAGWIAMKGLGPFTHPFPEIRAIAVLPHFDYFVWAVSARFGIASFQEMAKTKPRMRIALGRVGPNGPDLRVFTARQVLNRYGITEEGLKSWGGGLDYVGEPGSAVSKVLTGDADAVFHEAQFLPQWLELANSVPISFLSLDEDIARDMCSTFGFTTRRIPKGRYKGLERELLTLDYSDWLLFTTPRLEGEVARLVTEALVVSLRKIDETYSKDPPEHRSLVTPVKADGLSRVLGVPMHPGAEGYYREHGYVS